MAVKRREEVMRKMIYLPLRVSLLLEAATVFGGAKYPSPCPDEIVTSIFSLSSFSYSSCWCSSCTIIGPPHSGIHDRPSSCVDCCCSILRVPLKRSPVESLLIDRSRSAPSEQYPETELAADVLLGDCLPSKAPGISSKSPDWGSQSQEGSGSGGS